MEENNIKKMSINETEKVYLYIESESNSFPVSLKERINIKEFTNKILKFAEVYTYIVDNAIVGMIAYYANDDINKTAYLTYICVKEEFRSHKIGLQLMNKMFKDCKEKNMSKIQLSTNKQNIKAQKFYENLEFYKKNEVNDTIIYEKQI